MKRRPDNFYKFSISHERVEKIKIKDRIATALAAPPIWRSYHDLLAAVFPEKDYPKARNYGCNGGPPGCAMAFGRALREMREAKLIEHNFNGRGYSGDYVYRLCEKKINFRLDV